MINWAIRNQPIVHELEKRRVKWVLEVGSGAEGVAIFWRGRVTGVDLQFKRASMVEPVRGSVCALPFASQAWQTVVSCDMLEHVHPERREQALDELSRVTAQTLLLTFPSGPTAQTCYQNLARRMGPNIPLWLDEHLRFGLPDAGQVVAWLNTAGWQTRLQWYESANLHERLIMWEVQWGGKWLTYSVMRAGGRWLGPRWPVMGGQDWLRVLIVAERCSPV